MGSSHEVLPGRDLTQGRLTRYSGTAVASAEKLAFRILTDRAFDGTQRWIELQNGNSVTGVVLFTPPQHADRVGSFTGMSFKCDDLERTYAELVERGVEFLGPPRRESWVLRRNSRTPNRAADVLLAVLRGDDQR